MHTWRKVGCCLVAAVGTMVSVADTYYWFGKPGTFDSTFEGTTAKGAAYGWSLDPNSKTAPVAHTVSAEHDYVLQDYKTSYTRVQMTAEGCRFKGRTLTLVGTLPLCKGTGKLVCPKIIGGDYRDQTTATIGNWVGGSTMEVDADIQIDAGKAIGIRNVPSNAENRNTVLGTSDNKITGSGSLMLAGSGEGSAYYEILSDASEFTGTIDVGFTGSLPATPTKAPGPKNFTFKLSGPFGGTVTDLPVNTTKVIVNYDGLPQGKGLRVATTTIPAALKTKLYFWSSTADFTAKNFPLMTFPAGTGISTDDFKVYHRTTKDGSGTVAFADLGVQVNTDDGSMTLVANFEGQSIELNSWTAEPVLSKTSWMVREDEPGAVTAVPVAKYGAETMTVTMNGEPWDGTMPTSVGTYTIIWSVAETADYTGISVQRTFEITAFVDPVNSKLRYFAANGMYWKGASDMKSALEALPPEGGVIELNADLPDTQQANAYSFNKPVILRSSTHPDKVGQRFTFRYNAVKMVASIGSLNVSNLVFDAREVPSAYAFNEGVLGVQGGRLTLGEGVDVLTPLTWVIGMDGASIDVKGLVVTNHVGEFSAMVRAWGSTLTIHPGTRISNVRCSAVFASGADTSIVIKGGEIVDNVIVPDATSTRAAIKANGVIRIEGSPVIWNNKLNGKQSNVLPSNNSKITLTGDLGAKAKVGVSCGSAAGELFGVVESGDPGRGFVCDRDEHLQGRAKKDGKLYWKSTKSGLVVFLI